MISGAEFQTAASQLSDLLAVIANKGSVATQDETLLEDAIIDGCLLAGPPLSVIGPTIAPWVGQAIIAIVQNNRSMDPGALVPIASGKRGSDPWT